MAAGTICGQTRKSREQLSASPRQENSLVFFLSLLAGGILAMAGHPRVFFSKLPFISSAPFSKTLARSRTPAEEKAGCLGQKIRGLTDPRSYGICPNVHQLINQYWLTRLAARAECRRKPMENVGTIKEHGLARIKLIDLPGLEIFLSSIIHRSPPFRFSKAYPGCLT